MKIAILIPTWNNNQYLIPCVQSILAHKDDRLTLYIINNGDPENMSGFDDPRIKVLQQPKNMGWEGGLKAGLSVTTDEIVVFMNDDAFIPPVSKSNWIDGLLRHFSDPNVAAAGPSSNVVLGVQQIFALMDDAPMRVSFLIGFCMMVRRSALERVGGIDETLPGGDDFDLSIRFRKAGYSLICDRNVFVYHHGFKTGERVKGTPNQAGGWNSVEMMENTNFGLIRKHGLHLWKDAVDRQNLGTYEFQQA